jgi:hypothetical protein
MEKRTTTEERRAMLSSSLFFPSSYSTAKGGPKSRERENRFQGSVTKLIYLISHFLLSSTRLLRLRRGLKEIRKAVAMLVACVCFSLYLPKRHFSLSLFPLHEPTRNYSTQGL